MDHIPTELLQSVYLGSSALLAGLHVTLGVAAVPAIIEAADPVPCFKKLARPAMLMTITTAPLSALMGGLIYVRTDDPRFLTGAVLSLLVFPFTLTVMGPVNKQIFGTKPGDSGKVKRLLGQWTSRQWGRTLLAVGVFALGVQAVLFKKN